MILRDFPNLTWLKKQTNTNFDNQQSIQGKQLPQKGWPTVILNTSTTEVYRPDIRGPISLFMNIEGQSRCAVHGSTVTIPQGHFFVTNQHEHYTLEIESPKPVESFNIHFGEYFAESLLASLITPTDRLLENDVKSFPEAFLYFHSKLYVMDQYFQCLIQQLYTQHQEEFSPLLFEEQTSQLLTHLLGLHREEMQKVMKLPSVKVGTKIELYKRLSQVTDFIRTYYRQAITLDELAHLSCLSKHHFLRLFKIAFGLTPHQFIIQLRIVEACQLLQNSSLTIQEIAYALGFEYANSFSRLFKKKIGIYPNAYRDAL